jgi:tetratricopeptide (TPR) repeat protein
MEARLAANGGDAGAAVRLADALIRQTRVTGNGGLAIRAEAALRRALEAWPGHHEARRMLGAVLLTQHRFDEALAEARRSLADRPDDAFALGVLGDAHLELGNLDAAFAAFDRMAAIRPDAASYARVAHAREIAGDLDGAARAMAMALEATPAQDPEATAWYRVQLAHLHRLRHRFADARRELAHAEFVFPGHPSAIEGLARVELDAGQPAQALATLQPLLATAPAPALLALAGDAFAALGDTGAAERHYRLAEAAWESDAPEPRALARFRAERGRTGTR